MRALVAILALICAVSHAAQWPDIQRDGLDVVKQWAEDRINWAIQNFTQSGIRRMSSPNWQGKVVYQIQVDRFNNGDLSNDGLNLPPSQVQHQHTADLYDLPNYRHFGDLKGIQDRLDYLVDLGIQVLWLTPIFKHNGDYHGYCTTDPTYIDPGFGTDLQFRNLVAEAHKRGIYVVLDIVVNHLCDRSTAYNRSANHYDCPRDLNAKYWTGQSGGSGAQGDLNFSPNFFGPFRSPYFFNRCGSNSGEETSSESPAAIFGDFVDGMFDFDTRNWDFQDIFTLLHQYWVAFADVDGFRMDAAKHITDDFIASFATKTRYFAQSLGKTNFYVVGEVAASVQWSAERLGRMMSNPNNPNDHGTVPQALTNRMWNIQSIYQACPSFPFPGLNAVYDFYESGTSRDALLNHIPTGKIQDYFTSQDYRTLDAQADVHEAWTLLEIHDWPRFLRNDMYDLSKLWGGLGYLLTAQGMPIIYYGLEQGFNGNCNFNNIKIGQAYDQVSNLCKSDGDVCFRQDMFASGVWQLDSAEPSVGKMAYIGDQTPFISPNWTQDVFLRRDHVSYQLTRKLTHIRASCSALIHGHTTFSWVGDVGGLIAFSRVTQDIEVVVIVKPGSSGPFSLTKLAIDNGINKAPYQKYRNLFNTDQVATVGFENNQAFLYFNGLQIQAGEVQIFVHELNISAYNQYLQVSLCKA